MRTGLIFLFLLSCKLLPAQVVPVTLYYTNDRMITMPGNHSIVRECAIDTVAGEFSGSFTDTYINGDKIAEGTYEGGKLHGPLTAFYPNGVPFANGEYRNGRKYGIWRYYFANGKPMEVIEFDSSGLFIIETAYDAEGRQMVTRGTGKWVRTMETFPRPDYVIKAEFENGQRIGRWVYKSKYGHSYHVERYKNGELKNTTDRHLRKQNDSLFSTMDDRLFEFDQLKKASTFYVTMYAARHYPVIESVLKKASSKGSSTSSAYPDSLYIMLDLHGYINKNLRPLNQQMYEGAMQVSVTESMQLNTQTIKLDGYVPEIDEAVKSIIKQAPPLVRSPYNFRPGQSFILHYKNDGRMPPHAFIFISEKDFESFINQRKNGS